MITLLLCGGVLVEADDTREHNANPVQVLGDLNGDGRDDVLLRHTDGRSISTATNRGLFAIKVTPRTLLM